MTVSYTAVGHQLIESGVTSYARFADIHKSTGTPLTAEKATALMNFF